MEMVNGTVLGAQVVLARLLVNGQEVKRWHTPTFTEAATDSLATIMKLREQLGAEFIHLGWNTASWELRTY